LFWRSDDTMTFPDHFSDHADLYEAFRPAYPDALFAYLTSLVPSHDLAWDCATGNVQAALGLTPHFRAVVVADASHRLTAIPQGDWARPARRDPGELTTAWGDPSQEREVAWTLCLRVGIITGTKP
jgi:hypothetical protein